MQSIFVPHVVCYTPLKGCRFYDLISHSCRIVCEDENGVQVLFKKMFKKTRDCKYEMTAAQPWTISNILSILKRKKLSCRMNKKDQ